MDTFYDGDLDIWDSDLDPVSHTDQFEVPISRFKSESLKLSLDSDMDMFLERDSKIPHVILHDKLISDAMIGTLPIKTEHSYSLNSDGDSMPDSPGSLHNKIDDMEDDYYPAISMKTATNNRHLLDNHNATLINGTMANTNLNATNSNQHLLCVTSHALKNDNLLFSKSNNNNNNNFNSNNNNNSNNKNNNNKCYITTTAATTNNNNSNNNNNNNNNINMTSYSHNLRSNRKISFDGGHHYNSSLRDSISSASDIEIEDSLIKDEPLSPESSCPPSPLTQTYSSGISLNMANVAAITNADLVFEHKNGSLQLSSASQSLLKSQYILGTTAGQNIVIPKVNIKMEPQTQTGHIFGLPPTPPSSMPSDESEGNRSPEHHLLSPMSPPNNGQQQQQHQQIQQQQQQQQQNLTTSSGSTSTPTSTRRNTSSSSSSISSNSSNTPASNANASLSGRGYSGSSTRQPIHTPLISSQPKGSTGNLILTEEEKRTLLAEGYPIPTRLPLTKAEEKSLKKIRRKIKNKISAQESRRKKKEYMDQLERKVDILVSENSEYKKRVDSLEDSNASLLSQLHKLQALINKQNHRKA